MSSGTHVRSAMIAVAVVLVALLAPQATRAQSPTVVGQATALRMTVLGATTELAATGSLVDDSDARAASALSGGLPALGGADVLQATTISSIYGWDAGDEVRSAASLANLALQVAGSQIGARSVVAQAVAPVGDVATGSSLVKGLAINGVAISLTGAENETLALPGLTIVINEVRRSAGVITVNALHITSLDGLIDVVVASATAGIR